MKRMGARQIQGKQRLVGDDSSVTMFLWPTFWGFRQNMRTLGLVDYLSLSVAMIEMSILWTFWGRELVFPCYWAARKFGFGPFYNDSCVVFRSIH